MSVAVNRAMLLAEVPDVIVTVSSLAIVKLVAIADPDKATVKESAVVSVARERTRAVGAAPEIPNVAMLEEAFVKDAP